MTRNEILKKEGQRVSFFWTPKMFGIHTSKAETGRVWKGGIDIGGYVITDMRTVRKLEVIK